MAVTHGNEVAGHLSETYKQLPIGGEAWVRPDNTTSLKMFQVVAAAAKAMEGLGRISILQTHEEEYEAGLLIDAIQIRRLK
jgi:hypothetical protein